MIALLAFVCAFTCIGLFLLFVTQFLPAILYEPRDKMPVLFAYIRQLFKVGQDVSTKESLSSRLAGISLPDSQGNQVRLGSLWAESPAVLAFLRHYG
jgi:hypothetical protein